MRTRWHTNWVEIVMCFSAGASFGAGAVLSAIGATAMAKANGAPQKALAGVPLVFAAQQFSEGILWLSLTHPAYRYLYDFSMFAFLVFAQVVWPVYAPFTVLLLEKEHRRRRLLSVFLLMGLVTASYLLYCLFTYRVAAFAEHHHIRYDQSFPASKVEWFGVLYFIPTVMSSFVSGIRMLRLFGVGILVSCIFSGIFYNEFFISIWCYFAAALSLLLLFIIIRMNRKPSMN